MRETRNFHIQIIQSFLILSILIAIISMGIRIASADNDSFDECSLSNIVDLFPNGASEEPHLSSSPCHCFRFFAEQGVTYQIFTRPVEEGYLKTEIDLYDPIQNHVDDNEDFIDSYNFQDGTSLIEWTCPMSGMYYIKVKSYRNIEYRIQITSYQLQPQGTFIHGVPDYQQSQFLDPDDPNKNPFPGNCGPVAAACILGYWDARGFDRLVDANPARLKDVEKLVHQLQKAMGYSTSSGVEDPNVEMGILRVCNGTDYGNEYNFKVRYLPYPFCDFFDVMDEITLERPLLYGMAGHSIWGNHWMVTVGYLQTGPITSPTKWTINHDTWSNTHREIYVDWDEATDCIVTIQPGMQDAGGSGISYSTPLSYPFIIPSLIPGIGVWSPVGYSGTPYFPITGVPSYTTPFSFNIGYLNFYNSGTQFPMSYPSFKDGLYPERVMSSYSYYADPFPKYEYHLGTNLDNHNFSFQYPYSPLSGINWNYPTYNKAQFNNMAPISSLSLFPFTPLFPTASFFPYSMFYSPYSLSTRPLFFGFPF